MIQQESKILFCFSPLLHVYSELYRSNGSQKTPFNTPAGKRWGSRPDIFDFADFLKFFDKRFRFRNLFGNSKKAACAESGWMAERSKALVSGTSLFGGTGSNPVPIIFSHPYIFFPRVSPRRRAGGPTSELAQWKRVRLIT